MATLRLSHAPLASIFRFASQPSATTSRCTTCLKAQRCPFSSSRLSRQKLGSKRPLMTEHRPATLEADILPPVGAAKSESGGLTGQTWPPVSPWERESRAASISSLEQRQVQSGPTAEPSVTSALPILDQRLSAAPTAAPVAPKKSKLRARKAPITLTPLAVSHLEELQAQPEASLIRITVKNRGCSGLAYDLSYVTKAGAFDELVEQDGVKVLIDSKALFSIIGSEMDWVEMGGLGEKFVFRNPNITGECGCGESFSVS